MNQTKKQIKLKDVFSIFILIAKLTWKASPVAVITQRISIILSAALPIATTYFASLTTTELTRVYAGQGDPGLLIFYVTLTISLGIISRLWDIVDSYFSQIQRYHIESITINQMFEKLHSLEFWRYDEPETIDTFDKAKRFTRLFNYIFSQITRILVTFISLIIGVIALTTINGWLGILVILSIIPSAIINIRSSRLQAAHWRKNTTTRRQKYAVEDLLSIPEYVTELRLSGVIPHLIDKASKLRDQDQLKNLQYHRKFLLQNIGGEILQAASKILSLIWVILEIIAHRQPIGQFVFIQQMVSRIINDANIIASAYDSINEDMVNMADYQAFISLPQVKTSHLPKIPPLKDIIAFDHVSFQYPNSNKLTLSDLSLEVKQGQHVAIVGENGAGKTTFIKLLSGLYPPASGSITIDGRNLQSIDINSWHQQLATLSQDFIRYRFATAFDNIWYGDTTKPFNQKRLKTALENAEATDFISELPKGGDTYLSKAISASNEAETAQLSGGQWQRIALARSFYRNSPIIILDEPTSAIDAAAEARIFKHLFQQKDKTIITISHRLSTIKKADIIFFLRDGRVSEQGEYQDLVNRQGDFYQMFKDQL